MTLYKERKEKLFLAQTKSSLVTLDGFHFHSLIALSLDSTESLHILVNQLQTQSYLEGSCISLYFRVNTAFEKTVTGKSTQVTIICFT